MRPPTLLVFRSKTLQCRPMPVSDPTPLLVVPVIPVVTIERPRDAVPLARALMAGGLRIVEIADRKSVV